MYLSRLTLNIGSAWARRTLKNRYELHQTILKAFPDHDLESYRKLPSKERILYRIEPHPKTQLPSILIQSPNEPGWNFLTSSSYLAGPPELMEFSILDIPKGSVFKFKLFGNPTKRKNGKRIGLHENEMDQFNWLIKKGQQNGFKIRTADITNKMTVRTQRPKETHNIICFGVEYEGILEVIDPEKFEDVLKSGLGSGKGFGFGFLTIYLR